jgi:hypothetical protein
MYLCGVPVRGEYNSYALACRDAQDQLTGIARLVAPDDSVLVEGVCENGRAIGTWFLWKFGRLDRAFSIADGRGYGLRLYWSDGAYHSNTGTPMTGETK